jgi:hypothetical protein
VRLKPRVPTGTLPPELVDPSLWPLCPTYTGDQPHCVCWWAKRQSEFLAAGGEWPSGERCELADLIDMHSRFPCREPFDGSQI